MSQNAVLLGRDGHLTRSAVFLGICLCVRPPDMLCHIDISNGDMALFLVVRRELPRGNFLCSSPILGMEPVAQLRLFSRFQSRRLVPVTL